MYLQNILNEQLGGDTISQISQTLGADEGAVGNGIQAALPTLLGAPARNVAREPAGGGWVGPGRRPQQPHAARRCRARPSPMGATCEVTRTDGGGAGPPPPVHW